MRYFTCLVLSVKITHHTPDVTNPVEMCPIENTALWQITPPLQRQNIIDIMKRQHEAEMEEDRRHDLCVIENEMVNKIPRPVNRDEYPRLTG